MQDKKIFFLADAKSIHTAKWVDYFVSQNYNVYLATFSSINNTKCTQVYFLSNRKTHTNGKNYYYIFSLFKLAKILKEIKPDIINAHYSYSMGFIALLAKTKAKIRTTFTVVCHGSDLLDPPKAYLVDKLNRYILSKADKIVLVSNQLKDKVNTFGIVMDKVFIGQYGIKLKTDNLGIKDIDILSNRAYISNSRIDFLLEVMEYFQSKNLNIVFVLPDISSTSFDKLSLQYPYIQFYKEVEYQRMMHLISRSKIYISATKSDGTSLSLLEAMQAKLIPLISNIESNRSWVLDGINGYLFTNKKDFIVKLSHILTMQEEDKDTIYTNNLKLLEDKGNYTKQMKQIEIFLMENI